MDPFDLQEDLKRRTDISGESVESAWRRQVWLQIYLPFGVGLLLLLALIAIILFAQYGDASVWADLSVVILVSAALILGFLGLTVLVAASIGVIYLIRNIQEPFDQTRQAAFQAQQAVEEASIAAAKPVIAPQAATHAFISGVRYLAGIFKR